MVRGLVPLSRARGSTGSGSPVAPAPSLGRKRCAGQAPLGQHRFNTLLQFGWAVAQARREIGGCHQPHGYALTVGHAKVAHPLDGMAEGVAQVEHGAAALLEGIGLDDVALHLEGGGD